MKKGIALFLAMIMLTTLFAGCAKNEPAPAESSASEQQTQTQPATEKKDEGPVTIRFSHPGSSDAEKQFCATLKENVEKKYPNITVEFLNIPGGELLKKISIMLSAGDVPDLVAVQDIIDFVKMDALLPLDDIAAKEPELSLDNLNEAAVKFFSADGKVYALPQVVMGYALMANEKLLNDAGFKLEDIATWDDLVKACAAVSKNAGAAYGFAMDAARFTFRDFYIAAASNGLTYDKLSAPESKQKFIELMGLYKQLKPYFSPNWSSMAWPDLHRYIADGKLAFIGTGTYYQGYVSGLKKDAIEYLKPIPYPKGPSADAPMSFVAAFGYSIFKNSKNQEASVQVLKECFETNLAAEFAGAMHATALKNIPADLIQKGVEKAYGEQTAAQLDCLDKWNKILAGKTYTQPSVLGQTEIEKAYQDIFTQLLTDKLDPQQAYDSFLEKVKAIEAQYK